MTGLRFGALDGGAVHVAIDMQRLFGGDTEWASPKVRAIAPAIARIARHAPRRTIFTRFLTPRRAEQARGQWKIYYRRWASVLAGNLKPGMFGLLPELQSLAPPALVIDKYGHSGFAAPEFQAALDRLKATAIVFTGVETDVCVLATLLTAMDRGYRSIVVADAVASSSDDGHEACLRAIFPRFDQQLEVIGTDTLLESWTP